jgi:hypothetical protein
MGLGGGRRNLRSERQLCLPSDRAAVRNTTPELQRFRVAKCLGSKGERRKRRGYRVTSEPSILMMRLDAGSNRQGAPSVSRRSQLRPFPRLLRVPEGSSPPCDATAGTGYCQPICDGREFECYVDELRALGFLF